MRLRIAAWLLGVAASLIASAAPAAEFEVNQLLRVKGGVEISTSDTSVPAIFASSTTATGRVGIGTASPTAELDVAGTMTATEITCTACTAMQRRVTGSCAAGYVIRTINQDGTVVCEAGTPPGMIVLSTSTCATGYQELTSFQGRFIKGMPSGGTIAGLVGTPYTDLQSPAHDHGGASGSLDLAHTHNFDPPNTTSGGSSVDDCVYRDSFANDACTSNLGISGHTHATDIGSFPSAGASVSQSHSHTISSSGHVMPYIQVRVCMKP